MLNLTLERSTPSQSEEAHEKALAAQTWNIIDDLKASQDEQTHHTQQ